MQTVIQNQCTIGSHHLNNKHKKTISFAIQMQMLCNDHAIYVSGDVQLHVFQKIGWKPGLSKIAAEAMARAKMAW